MPGRRISHSEQWWAVAQSTHPMVTRCVSPNQSGTQCKREAVAGSVVCDHHGVHLPNVVNKAKERYVNLADKAAAVVEAILDNPASSDAAKLKAAEIVGRATGMQAAAEVVVDFKRDPFAALFKAIIDDPDGLDPPSSSEPLQLPAAEVVLGEVVGTSEEVVVPPAPAAHDGDDQDDFPDAEVVTPLRKPSSPNPARHVREGLGIA